MRDPDGINDQQAVPELANDSTSPPAPVLQLKLNRANAMAFLIVLVLFCAPYLVTRLLRAEQARMFVPTGPQRARTESAGKAQTDIGSPDGLSWSALDDLQLTRLLTDSAPRTNTE